mgnify:CR=1 FL=1
METESKVVAVEQRENAEWGASHYQDGIGPSQYAETNDMGYAEFNIIKYVTRYKRKGTPLRDLQKARDYLDILISRVRAT